MTCYPRETSAPTMESARKSPCHECPFRLGGPVGWTGSAAPEEFAAAIIHDERLPCHQTIDYEDPQWQARWSEGEIGQLCAGALTMAANRAQRSRSPSRPVYPADRVNVYPSLQAMIEAHRASSVRSWKMPDHAPVVTAIRTRLMMSGLVAAPPEDAPQAVGEDRRAGCAHPGCRTPVTPDDHCAGCGFHICERHCPNVDCMGPGHDVTEHWNDPDGEV